MTMIPPKIKKLPGLRKDPNGAKMKQRQMPTQNIQQMPMNGQNMGR